MATTKSKSPQSWAARIPLISPLLTNEKTRLPLTVALWLLSFAALWFLGKGAIWLYSLDGALKNQRHMRIELREGDATHITQLDGSELETLTRELQGLSFVHLGDMISKIDYVPDRPPELPAAPIADPRPTQSASPKVVAETQTDGIARILAHPTHGCYAVLQSVVSVARFPPEMKRADIVNIAPFRTGFVTLSGSNEDSWSFATHNREAEPFTLLLQRPRHLSHRMLGASAAQLLENHLAERDEISSRGGFGWDKALSLKQYKNYEERAIPHFRGVFQRATTLGVAWQLFTFRFSKHERWMGELAGR